MPWLQITITIPTDSSEPTVAHLLDAGCSGVAELVRASCTPEGERASDWLRPDKEVMDDGLTRITGYLEEVDDVHARIRELRIKMEKLPEYGLPAPICIVQSTVQEMDWASEWKKYFKPVEIGKRLVIKPSWETYDGPRERIILELDPGQAFGTGGHQTTRLCLIALEEFVHPGYVVADIGTGSGILAIAAARLGASLVYATDIDSLPRRVASENARLNGLSDLVHVEEMDEFDRKAINCDLVVANIISDILIDLAPAMAARLKPGGILITSGIVEEREEDVLAALDACGLLRVKTLDEELWRANVSRKPE